jgi:cytochrome c oxidase subunit 1
LFGWVKALPWDNPMMLAVTFSFIMLGFGGAGGIINMSYQLNETIHNTQWVTGHFHLIFAGAIVLMYFMLAYELWPQLTGCAPLSAALIKAQIWLWFVGMMVLTMPWHLVGLLGAPRRMAYYDYSHPDLQSQAWTVSLSAIGGFVLLVSGVLLVYILATARRRADIAIAPFTFSRTAHPGAHTPTALNGFRLWIAMMIGLTVVNYGYPIAQLASLKEAYVPVIPIGSR